MADSTPSIGKSLIQRALEAGGHTANMLEIEKIRRDGGTQPRAELDQETLDEYASRMKRHMGKADAPLVDPEGAQWDPVVVFYDGTDYWLADGFHRLAAAEKAGYATIQGKVLQGSQRDAIKHSLGVNARHGKRRTNEDKRRAVFRAFQDEDWVKLSDREIGRMCKVSHPFVSKLRKELEEAGDITAVMERVGADGKTYDTTNIGSAGGNRYQVKSTSPSKADLKAVAPTIRKRQELPDLEEETSPDLPVNPVEVVVEKREEVASREYSPVCAYGADELTSIQDWGRVGHDVKDFDLRAIITPLPLHFRWPVAGLRDTRLQDRERGACVIGGEVHIVWAVQDVIVPTTAASLAELVEFLESEVAK